MKDFPYIKRGEIFASCTGDYDNSTVILFGAGYDGTSSNRPGSKFGPSAIRKESYGGMEDYSPYFDCELTEHAIYDLGDLELLAGDKEDTLSRIEQTVASLLKDNKIPLMLGGEHLITLPAVKAAADKYDDLLVIHLDAHLDLMDELYGSSLSHGTVMRRIYELWNEKGRIWQAGIRSGSKEEFIWAKDKTFVERFKINALREELKSFGNRPVYFSLDLDVFDPSLISGTGTPEAGGILFNEFMALLTDENFRKLNIIGMDVVELAPELEGSNVSATVTAQLVRELMAVTVTKMR